MTGPVTGGPSGWDIAAIGTVATGLLTAAGSAFWKLVTRADRKEAALVKKLEARIAELERRDENRARESLALRVAFEIVANVVRRDNPLDPELLRAEAILAKAFPVDPVTPPDMAERLKQIP